MCSHCSVVQCSAAQWQFSGCPVSRQCPVMDWGRYGWDRAAPQYNTYLQVVAKHFTEFINCAVHWTMFTNYCTQHTAQLTLHNSHSLTHTLHSKLHTQTPHSITSHFTLHTPNSIVYTALSTLNTVDCTIYTPHSSMQRALCPKDRSLSWIYCGGCLCSGSAVRIWALCTHVKNKLNIVHYKPCSLVHDKYSNPLYRCANYVWSIKIVEGHHWKDPNIGM